MNRFWSQFNLIDADNGDYKVSFDGHEAPMGQGGHLPVSSLYHTLYCSASQRRPPEETTCYLLQFDGGANPNPGPASSGAILYSPDRRPIVERGVFHQRATNNLAEYGGLLTGLQLCLSNQVRHIVVEGDSQLVVRQLTGQYKVRDPALLPHYQRIKQMVRMFEYVAIRHVYREDNTEADRITKDVLRRREAYEYRYS